jgi:hypothetical protein
MSAHLGMWRSAVTAAKRRPQCGHGTLGGGWQLHRQTISCGNHTLEVASFCIGQTDMPGVRCLKLMQGSGTPCSCMQWQHTPVRSSCYGTAQVVAVVAMRCSFEFVRLQARGTTPVIQSSC